MMFPKKYLLPFLAIATGLLVAGIIIALTGANPFKAFYALLQGSGLAPKASYAGHKNMLTDFLGYINFLTPMIFAALGTLPVSLSFKEAPDALLEADFICLTAFSRRSRVSATWLSSIKAWPRRLSTA